VRHPVAVQVYAGSSSVQLRYHDWVSG
jgi:hypothetical protein